MFERKWTGITVLVMAFALFFSTGVQASEVFVGSAYGYKSDIVVEVEVVDGKVVAVEIIDHDETAFISDAAFAQIPGAIVKSQSLDVDMVSGATKTSVAIADAVKVALEEAGISFGGAAAAATVAERKGLEVIETELVIVGGGGAGLIAAIQAVELGADVIVLEKMPFVGGSTLLTGRLGGRGSSAHIAAGSDMTVMQFAERVYAGGEEKGSWDHILRISEEIGEALDWFMDMGMEIYINPASPDRPEHPAGNHGAELVKVLQARAYELGVAMMMQTEAKELIVEDGKVTGVYAVQNGNPVIVKGNAVILATGEFGGSAEHVAQYAPEWIGLLTNVQPTSSRGDGHRMAETVGAQLVGMNWVVLRPGYMPDGTRVDAPHDGILVNAYGERFIDESENREALVAAMRQQPAHFAWMVLTEDAARGIRRVAPHVDSDSEYIATGASVAELAVQMGVPADALQTSVMDYAAGPYVAVKIQGALYTSLGGVATDLDTRVLDANNQPIPGLYAAGGVTGMLGNGRSAGANHAQIAVFGRAAAETAIADSK